MAAVLEHTGRLCGTQGFPASTGGYVALVTWAERFGPVERIGVDGTGTYGAGLTRFVPAYGLEAVAINRPDRSLRRRRGTSDPIHAQAAARATLAGVAATAPKTREGQVEMIRVLRVAHRGALKARVAAAEQLYGVLSSAPEELRQPLLGRKTKALVGACAAMRPGPLTSQWLRPRPAWGSWPAAGNSSRPNSPSLTASSRSWWPRSRPPWSPCPGSGSTPPGNCWSPPVTTPAAGWRGCLRPPVRCRPDPGVLGPSPPPPAHRGGDRRANHALWRIALVRMRCHPPTRASVERRTNQGLSKPDILRCLKRYIAREVYHHLTDPSAITPPTCPK